MDTGFLNQGKTEALSFTPINNTPTYAQVAKRILPINTNVIDKRPFLTAVTNTKAIKWLLDTGASLSVMEENLFKQLNVPKRKVPDPYCVVTGATGHSLKLLGTYMIPLSIAKHGTVFHPVTIAKVLPTKAILGNDFIKKYGLVIDGATGKHIIKGLQTSILTLSKDIFIPPMSGKLIKLKPHNEFFELPTGTQGIVENKADTDNAYEILEVIAAVQPDGLITTAITNNTHNEVRLTKGAEIALLQPIRIATPLRTVLDNIQTTHRTTDTPNTQVSDKKRKLIQNLAKISGSPKFKTACLNLLLKYHTCISDGPYDLGRTNLMQHTIYRDNTRPIHVKQFRLPWQHRQHINNFVDELLKKGCIQISKSPYNAPIFCVQKPHDAGLRVVQDFRQLNEHTIPDRYVIREVADCIDEIGRHNSKIFSSLDLTSGFWQLKLSPESRECTAFTVPGRGRYEWITMPMGLHGAPASFARMMDCVMQGAEGIITYIDDVLVHSPNEQQHLVNLETCFKRLTQHNLKLNLSKCLFAATKIPYLGYTLTKDGVQPGEEKTKAVQAMPEPDSIKKIKEFTGLTNYFRHMIPGYTNLASKLTRLTAQNSSWRGGPLPEDARKAFHKLKAKLCSQPILAYPRKDLPFILATDAATGDPENPGGLGAVLMQVDPNGNEHVISYASRTLKKHENNYSAYLLERQAAIWAIEHFSVYLKGKQFTLLTDHKPLEALNTRQQKTLNRLQELLCEYQFKVKYREGTLNTVPDALSRNAIDEIVAFPTMGLTKTQLRTTQRTDTYIQLVLQYLKLRKLPDNPKLAKQIISLSNITIIHNDLVYVITDPKRDELAPLLWVPHAYTQLVIKAAHCTPYTGHTGVAKTLQRIIDKYWWPTMRQDVQQFIYTCATCQRSKDPPKMYKILPQKQQWQVPDRPNQRIHIDLFGPLKTSAQGNKYVMVITDAFSKYTTAKAISNKDANTVAETLFTEWICKFSCPKTIVSDNGKEFVNTVMKHLLTRLGIQHSKTSVGHPQTNAAAETFNRTIINYMKVMLNDETLDWEKWIPPMLLAYNTRVHEAIKTTPFFLTYSMDPSLPYFDLNMPRIPYSDSWAEYAYRQAVHAWKLANIHLTVAGQRNATQQSVRQTPSFQKGDRVLVLRPNLMTGQNAKFLQQWTKNYIIIKQVGPVTFEVKNEKTGRQSLFHLSRLKKDNTLTRSNMIESSDEESGVSITVQDGQLNNDNQANNQVPGRLGLQTGRISHTQHVSPIPNMADDDTDSESEEDLFEGVTTRQRANDRIHQNQVPARTQPSTTQRYRDDNQEDPNRRPYNTRTKKKPGTDGQSSGQRQSMAQASAETEGHSRQPPNKPESISGNDDIFATTEEPGTSRRGRTRTIDLGSQSRTLSEETPSTDMGRTTRSKTRTMPDQYKLLPFNYLQQEEEKRKQASAHKKTKDIHYE